MTHSSTRHAFTLIEMLLSMTLCLLILGILQSLLILSSNALPSSKVSPLRAARLDSQLDYLASDLRDATAVLSLTTSSIELLLPDKTSDGLPDRALYTWNSSQPNSPLYRQLAPSPTADFSAAPAATMLASAYSVSISPDYATETLTSPSASPTTAGIEVLGAERVSAVTTATPLTASTSYAQVISATVPSSASTFKIPRIFLRLSRASSTTDGILVVSLTSISGSETPTQTILTQRRIPAASLPPSPSSWFEIRFPECPSLTTGTKYAIVISPSVSNLASLDVQTSTTGPFLTSTNGGSSWSSLSTTSMLYRVHVAPSDQSAAAATAAQVRNRLAGISLSVRTTSSTRTITRYFHAPNVPMVN